MLKLTSRNYVLKQKSFQKDEYNSIREKEDKSIISVLARLSEVVDLDPKALYKMAKQVLEA